MIMITNYYKHVMTHHNKFTKNTTVTKLRGCSVELQGSSKVGIRDTLVFLICLMCWGGRLFLKGDRQEARLILFYKIINGLAQVPFEGVLVEAYKVLEENTT